MIQQNYRALKTGLNSERNIHKNRYSYYLRFWSRTCLWTSQISLNLQYGSFQSLNSLQMRIMNLNILQFDFLRRENIVLNHPRALVVHRPLTEFDAWVIKIWVLLRNFSISFNQPRRKFMSSHCFDPLSPDASERNDTALFRCLIGRVICQRSAVTFKFSLLVLGFFRLFVLLFYFCAMNEREREREN